MNRVPNKNCFNKAHRVSLRHLRRISGALIYRSHGRRRKIHCQGEFNQSTHVAVKLKSLPDFSTNSPPDGRVDAKCAETKSKNTPQIAIIKFAFSLIFIIAAAHVMLCRGNEEFLCGSVFMASDNHELS